MNKDTLFPKIAAGLIEGCQAFSVLSQLLRGEKCEIIPVADAVQIQHHLVVCLGFVGFAVGSGADQACFFQIKQNKSDFLPLVFRHTFGNFQQGHHAGGVVVGVAGVGGANQHQGQNHPNHQVSAPCADGAAAGKQAHPKAQKHAHRQNQQRKYNLPEQKQP